MIRSILLLTEDQGQPWNRVLADAIFQIGSLVEADEPTAMKLLIRSPYDLVLIDASIPVRLPLLVARVRAVRPDCPIVVATASPEWIAAREVFQAGAADYFSKTFDKNELLNAVKSALRRGPREA